MKEETKRALRSLQRRREKRWEDCICGNYNIHSPECKRNHQRNRLKKYVSIHREKRQKLKKQHRCIICGNKVKPKIVYYQLCDKHSKLRKEYEKKVSESNKSCSTE